MKGGKKPQDRDEEFYIPLLPKINEEKELLEWAGKWIYWYNVKRPPLERRWMENLPY